MTEQQAADTREREIEYLVDRVGYDRAYWERVFEDDDLWILVPEQRHAFEGEEGVRQWEVASDFTRALCRGFADPGGPVINDAMRQLLWDMRDRAEEALRRARQREGLLALRNTVFGQVLAELLRKRGLPVTPFGVGKLAEEAGLDGWKVINRMADSSAGAGSPGRLDGLAGALDLSEPEKMELAHAYTFEQRAHYPGHKATV